MKQEKRKLRNQLIKINNKLKDLQVDDSQIIYYIAAAIKNLTREIQ